MTDRLKSYWRTCDSYTIAAWLIFAASSVYAWRAYVRSHEAIYLLGSRRVVDPSFLADDISWHTLPPTTFAFDHLLAPLWSVLDDFGIVTVGRLITLFLFSWSLAVLARTLKLPTWSMVAGFILWVLCSQTLVACGKPIEGFQPKSFAYPMIFFSLAFAIRGQMVRAGLTAGVGTLFHIIVGGWGCLALFLSMVVNRDLFSPRQLGVFLLSTAPFIAPLVLVVAFFHTGGVSSADQALMDAIYVKFSQAVCCDPDYFWTDGRMARAALVLPVAPLVVFLWPQRPAARVLGCFVALLVVFFVLGLWASESEANWFLKLYPFQLAFGLPGLFLFVFTLAVLGEHRPKGILGRIVLALGIFVAAWMIDDHDVLTERVVEVPRRFANSLERATPGRFSTEVSASQAEALEWIKEHTPPGSVFVTPYLPAFWTYAERSQVAALRHPPHDRGLIEWKERLEAINGFRPFEKRGSLARAELNKHQPRLDREQLIRIRDLYGATHYLTSAPREELDPQSLYSKGNYHLYDLSGLRFEP